MIFIALLSIRVQAGAGRERIIGWQGDQLRVAVQAPPVEGAANRALIRLLARSFRISPSRIAIVRGEKTKHKTVELKDVTDDEVKQLLGS